MTYSDSSLSLFYFTSLLESYGRPFYSLLPVGYGDSLTYYRPINFCTEDPSAYDSNILIKNNIKGESITLPYNRY